jgi:hypothetical protein
MSEIFDGVDCSNHSAGKKERTFRADVFAAMKECV